MADLSASDGSSVDAQMRFGALLTRLGGAAAYEALRRRLIVVLRVHVPQRAEELADEAFERLSRRLGEGASIDNPALFALGIARKLVLEAQADAARQARMAADPAVGPNAESDAVVGIEVEVAAVDACLERLAQENRTLLLDYYAADGGARILVRQRLAARLGISLNALRNRALRLREMLAGCVRKRLNRHVGA